MPIRRQSRGLLPVKNARLVDVALRTLENLSEINKDNVRNSIEATGYPVTVYVKKLNGRRCTCYQRSQSLLNEQGKLSTGSINQLVTGFDSGVENYGNDNRTYTEIEGTDGKIETTFSAEPNTKKMSLNGNGDPMDDLEFDSEMAADITEEDNRVFIGSSRSCGVCFNTTFVGGYTPMHGTRIVCDVTYDHSRSRVEIDNIDSPSSFLFTDVAADAHVTFDIMVPKSAQFGLSPRLYDNKQVLDSNTYVIEASNTGGSLWFVLNASNVMSLALGTKSQLRVKSLVENFRFTHAELIYSHNAEDSPFRADFAETSRQTIVTIADALAGVNIIMPGELALSRGSIVIDHLPKLSRHWMINTITPRKDKFGKAYDVSCDSRVQDLNELGQLLRPLTNLYIYPIT